MQGLEADLQQSRGFGFVVSGLSQRTQNHLTIDYLDRRAHREGDGVFGARAFALVERIRCEVMSFDLLAGTNNYRPLDHIAQFAHVARPSMKAQGVERGRAEE